MGRTVRELQATLNADELAEYIAFDQLDPWWHDRRDFYDAYAMAQQASSKKKTFRPSDFLVKWDRAPVTPQRKEALLRAGVLKHGGKVIDSSTR